MRTRILEFVQALREGGVDVSVAETLDAVAAVAAAGVERGVLREALAAALVKDEGDRPRFDRLFDAMFPLVGAMGEEPGRKRRRRTDGGSPGEGTGSGTGEGRGGRRDEARGEPARTQARNDEVHRRAGEPVAAHRERDGLRPGRAARAARLLQLPFADFSPPDAD